MLVAFVCKSSRAGWLLIDTFNSVLFCNLPQATDKQCSQRCNSFKFTVCSGVDRVRARISLHLSLAAETDPCTDKLLRSTLRFGTYKPDFRYIMPCFADVAKLVVLRVEGKLMKVF